MGSKVVTGKVRFSYVSVFSPRKAEGDAKEKYSICLIIDKEDKKTVDDINKAVAEAIEQGVSSKWGGKKPSNLHMPLRDGDMDRDTPEFTNKYFINAKSDRKPGVVDRDRNDILDTSEIYSGCYGRASISFFPYDSHGNKGVGVGLNHIQKLSDGEMLGDSSTAQDDFSDGFEDDEDF